MPDWQEFQEVNEIALLRKAQGGDAEAFGDIYELYAPAIFRFLYSHLNNRLDAEDLTEEVFLRVWRSIANYQEQGIPFIAYLYRIARNALIDFYRRSHRSDSNTSLEDENLRDNRADPAEAAFANIEHQEIHRVMAELRDEYRTVLALRFLGNLTPEETAEAMGKSAGAVRVLQHRALAALRKLLRS
jgi:RNA polymerase sigma-70 factor (ECF subfamily)